MTWFEYDLYKNEINTHQKYISNMKLHVNELFKTGVNRAITFQYKSLLLLVCLHNQSSSSDDVGGLLQVLQAPI